MPVAQGVPTAFDAAHGRRAYCARRRHATLDLYRTRFPGHKTRLSGLLHDGLVPCGPCVAGALETILLEPPGGVVSGDKVAHGGANLIDGLIDAAMDDLLLEGAEEPLRDTIGLGFTDERVAWAHAPEADLVLEVPGHEGAAMVVAQRDAAGSGGAEMAEDGLDRHADGLGRGVAIAAFADVPAGCLGVPVLDHAEQPDLELPPISLDTTLSRGKEARGCRVSRTRRWICRLTGLWAAWAGVARPCCPQASSRRRAWGRWRRGSVGAWRASARWCCG